MVSKFCPFYAYGNYLLPWQPEFKSNQPRIFMKPYPVLEMCYMKYDLNWATDFREVWMDA